MALLFAATAFTLTLLTTWLVGEALSAYGERRLSDSFEVVASQIGDSVERAIHERNQDLVFATRWMAARPGTEPAELRGMLESLMEASPDFAWLGVVNVDGTIAAATQRQLEGQHVAERAWYRAARTRSVVMPPREAPEIALVPAQDDGTDPRVLDIAMPVPGESDQPTSVLAAQVRWSLAQSAISAGLAEAVRRDHVGVTIYNASGETLFDSGTSGWTEPPDLSGLTVSNQPRGALTEATATGAIYATGYVRTRGYRGFRGLDLVIAVRQPIELALSSVRQFRRYLLMAGLTLTGLCGMLGWMAAAPLSRELRRISATAIRIRAGDALAILPASEGKGEIARACRDLRALVERLRGRDE